MSALREIAERCRFDDVSILHPDREGDLPIHGGARRSCARAPRTRILEASGIDTAVTTRTAAQLRKVLEAEPVARPDGGPETKLSVTFLFDGVTPTVAALDPETHWTRCGWSAMRRTGFVRRTVWARPG